MLRLYFGDLDDAMLAVSLYFDEVMDNHCITTEFSKRMIKEISEFEVLGNNIIRHPIFGDCSAKELAGGIKALLILMYGEEDIPIDLAAMGDNCFPYLAEIARARDITVCTTNWREICFDDPIYLLNSNKVATSKRQVYDEWSDYYAKKCKVGGSVYYYFSSGAK